MSHPERAFYSSRCSGSEDCVATSRKLLSLDAENSPRDVREAYEHCLSVYDRDKDLIQAAARRLIEANLLERDGAVIVSSFVFALDETNKTRSTV